MDINSTYRSWDSAVGIATGYELDRGEVRVRLPVGSRIFSSPRRPDCLSGPSSHLYHGYRGVKRPGREPFINPTLRMICGILFGREADNSLPTSAEVKKIWIYISTPSSVFMA
jgi:hypothetical protein